MIDTHDFCFRVGDNFCERRIERSVTSLRIVKQFCDECLAAGANGLNIDDERLEG